MRNEYRARRARVLEAFRRSSFAEKVTIFEQGAGLHFLLKLRTDRPDAELKTRAEALGVRLSFLSEYAAVPRAEFAHALVVNYAGPEQERLEDGMALLAQVFAE